eukprot:TRINITY_DN4929_c0_g1_i9.p1 TRINITY_DN4929_c0_g1~~TRINITY_DN4929_c0_g1_i9.p1  ORF type:complete len:190 (+),score=30.03 TRINITY_DN4929_c0_g1_i9:293-862(+)
MNTHNLHVEVKPRKSPKLSAQQSPGRTGLSPQLAALGMPGTAHECPFDCYLCSGASPKSLMGLTSQEDLPPAFSLDDDDPSTPAASELRLHARTVQKALDHLLRRGNGNATPRAIDALSRQLEASLPSDDYLERALAVMHRLTRGRTCDELLGGKLSASGLVGASSSECPAHGTLIEWSKQEAPHRRKH